MSPIRMKKIESPMRIVLQFHNALNRHDVAGMMQLMSENCVFENTAPAPDGTRYTGKEAVSRFWQDFFHESPRARIDIEEIFGMDNHCIMRWKYTWGEGHVRGVDVFKVEDDLITEKLSYVKG
jgi:predicted SnoaL-like aldol condensation-catalyzing enzyme